MTTASMAGLTGVFGCTGCSATKFAVIGFSEALRREVRLFGIRVSVLGPPNTRTPGFEEENRHKPAEVLKAEETVSTVDPDVVAAALLRKLPKNPFVITADFDSRLAHLLIRPAPWIVERDAPPRFGEPWGPAEVILSGAATGADRPRSGLPDPSSPHPAHRSMERPEVTADRATRGRSGRAHRGDGR